MYNFNKDNFAEFMQREYGIIVDRNLVGEESVLLYKDELDERIISKRQKKRLPDQVIIQTCSYNKKSEWMVGILCSATDNHPLVLICIKDGNRIMEKSL